MAQLHNPSSRRASGIVWMMTLLLLLAFVLRVWRAAHDTLWFDEGISVWMARMPLQEMFPQTARDTFPPLFYMLLSGWRIVAGEDLLALKLLSVACGMFTVAISYRIGREVAGRTDPAQGRWIGLAGALLVTLAWPQIWASQEIRQYPLGILLGAVALWAALRLFNRPERPWTSAVVLAASQGAGLLTLYLFAQVPLALNLAFVHVFLASKRRWKLAGAWIAAQIASLAMFAPWLFYSWGAMRRETEGAHAGLGQLVSLYLSVIFTGEGTDLVQYQALWLVGAAALVIAGMVSLICSRRGQRPAWTLLVIGTIMPVLLFFVMTLPVFNLYRPPPAGRYFVLLSTAVYVLLGWGAVALVRVSGRSPWVGRAVGSSFLAILAGISIWGLGRYYGGLLLRDDYLSAAAMLEALRQPDDAVFLNNDADWPVFAYHYPDTSVTRLTQQRLETLQDAEYLLGSHLQENGGIWLVQNRFGAASDPNNYLRLALEDRALAWRHYVFPEAELWFCALTGSRAAPGSLDQVVRWPDGFVQQTATIADGVQLAGYTRLMPEVDAGDMLVLGLGWQVEAGSTGPWTVAVKIAGADGQDIVSTLVTLDDPAGEHFTPVEIFVPPDAPVGQASIALLSGRYYTPLTSVSIRPAAWVQTSSAALPDSATAMGIHYGDDIILAAVQLPEQARWRAGESIPLTLYWQPLAAVPERYKVFVHLIGDQVNPAGGNTMWGQQDQEPQGGTTQTTRWLPGEMIPDEYTLAISDDVPPGHYTLQVGLYPLLGGTRLLAADPDGASLGDSVIVYEFDIVP
jgi:uncharacterized membrane protein